MSSSSQESVPSSADAADLPEGIPADPPAGADADAGAGQSADAPSDKVEAAAPASPAGDVAPQAASPAATAAKLAELFPALFKGAPKPLKLRIQIDIQERAPGVFTKQALSAFFRRHTGGTGYLIAVSKGTQRFDLDGQPAGELSDEHRKVAADELARRRANAHAKREEEEAGRRQRAGLLRDFETTRLTTANFCALKGIAPDQLDGLLAQARAEALEDAQRPRRPEHGHPRRGEGAGRRDGAPGDRRGGPRGGEGGGRDARESREGRDGRPGGRGGEGRPGGPGPGRGPRPGQDQRGGPRPGAQARGDRPKGPQDGAGREGQRREQSPAQGAPEGAQVPEGSKDGQPPRG